MFFVSRWGLNKGFSQEIFYGALEEKKNEWYLLGLKLSSNNAQNGLFWELNSNFPSSILDLLT